MSHSYFRQVASTLVVAFGLLLGLLAGTASAQVIDSAPRAPAGIGQSDQAQTQGSASSYGVRPQGSASSYGVGTSGKSTSAELGASACGWQRPVYWHCGGNQFVLVRVDFAWSWDTTDIWVTRGGTDLERRFGRSIDFAWCVQNC
jgi:hypothetical protein